MLKKYSKTGKNPPEQNRSTTKSSNRSRKSKLSLLPLKRPKSKKIFSPVKRASLAVRREFSAGGVVWKKENGKILFLIIQPKGTERWQFPKGHIEEKESSKDASVREVREEGGVVTKISQKLGIQQYFFVWEKEKIFKTVITYLLEYLSGSTKDHDKEVENAVFLEFDKAHEKLTFKRDKEDLIKANDFLKQGIQESLV